MFDRNDGVLREACSPMAWLLSLTVVAAATGLVGCFSAGDETVGDAATNVGADSATQCDACSVSPGAEHVVAACLSGTCEVRCEAGWVDDDGDKTNGCELECKETNGGTEICDGKDNDCDSVVDNGFQTGECTVGQGVCQRTGTFECVSDSKAECSVEVGTPAEETCGDGKDNDCDGETDEDDASDAKTWYADADGDSFGTSSDKKTACQKPDGYVGNDDDCDDADPQVKPRPFYPDSDGDGYTTATAETKCNGGSAPSGYETAKSTPVDCDDSSMKVSPSASEACDGRDTDCDGQTDNIAQNSSAGTLWYVDCDADGFAPGATGKTRACSKPAKSKLTGTCSSSSADWTKKAPTSDDKTDCNDDAADAHPGQTGWFAAPMSGSDHVGKWDYDCNGNVEYRWTSGTSCDEGSDDTCKTNCTGPACTVEGGGWVGGASPFVDCGKSAQYHACAKECCFQGCSLKKCATCANNANQRTQKCR